MGTLKLAILREFPIGMSRTINILKLLTSNAWKFKTLKCTLAQIAYFKAESMIFLKMPESQV